MTKVVDINPRDVLKALAAKLIQSDEELVFAQNVASAVVASAANHCAATMSGMLVFNQVYPVGVYKGYSNIEQAVLPLAKELSNNGWIRTNVAEIKSKPFEAGDLGVVDDGKGTHHIYLVLDASDQKQPLIADNQAPPHKRPVSGGSMPGIGGATATLYFLRAPNTVKKLEYSLQLVV